MKVLVALEDGSTTHFRLPDGGEIHTDVHIGGNTFFRVRDPANGANSWFNSTYVVAIIPDDQELTGADVHRRTA